MGETGSKPVKSPESIRGLRPSWFHHTGQKRGGRLRFVQVKPPQKSCAAALTSDALALVIDLDKPGLSGCVHDHLTQIAANPVTATLLPATIAGMALLKAMVLMLGLL
jgi:hypothetical protein